MTRNELKRHRLQQCPKCHTIPEKENRLWYSDDCGITTNQEHFHIECNECGYDQHIPGGIITEESDIHADA